MFLKSAIWGGSMHKHPVVNSFLLKGALLFFSILLPALFHPGSAWAQVSTVTGTVKDASGATVPGAAVKVHNAKTGIDNSAVTNNAGVYHINEPAGVYDVTFQKTGFKVAAFTDVTLTVDQVLTLNASLEVGAITQVVEVSGQSVAPIDLESGQISNIVE